MHYLHTMLRVGDLDASLRFWTEGLGLTEVRRIDNEAGRFTLIFLATPADFAAFKSRGEPQSGQPTGLPTLELTHNWDETHYDGGPNFGHVAYKVDDIYGLCQHLMDLGYVISRPPRDGNMAFVRSPDLISVELLQKGDPLPPKEPWLSMANTGVW